MEAATKLGLPWRLLREKLAPPDIDQSPTEVTYRRTLEMLEDDLIVSGGGRKKRGYGVAKKLRDLRRKANCETRQS